MLSGAWNFRDVAETAGIRPGLLYRSSELSRLTDDGREEFRELGITDVADLRSHQEVERRGPGQVPYGVTVHLLPFHPDDDSNQDAPHESTFQRVMAESQGDDDVSVSARRYMTEVYEEFPGLPGAHNAVRQVISLLGAKRPVIAHCFAGKDRTGFTVATVLSAVGVERDAVITDFLRSNDAIVALRERIMESVRARADSAEVITFAEARLSDEVLGVREEYLDAAWRKLEDAYGSVDGFVKAAGVTPEELTAVRDALLG
ncbi:MULTISPECIES: tyrosine-protein phosphatase [Mycolicibacterium]|uniref:Phosphotyrosine protein phosphatase n=1 Tax=Mycolicibacterium mageritense TaxID=53462 RepID=A0AAI8TT82_MYCME|nr:tyrosine-protein phosphatase [Mycolicibacterium mageritense]MBN3457360.1 tyrosine-protein phosphatase [Mycobacterium sp. DSM 3803]MCC9181608.1 tyrosine-protein phosphatase [Mycolicibacterium mageritense]TXI58076.1 MAG: tyrosine-protein phosphatase [Mycolicibacterium mageritense]CDO21380.1 phosphotyrosine protein phosphatase ptpb [Mycolicibacterium mageritense DSM 44476 = CIP 104973]BBX32947.1 phosphotyrosine protein phosphatase [Mycolicibacterium mageritense]